MGVTINQNTKNPTGIFKLQTATNAYRIELNRGYIIDAPPVLHEFLKQRLGVLLRAVNQVEGHFELSPL